MKRVGLFLLGLALLAPTAALAVDREGRYLTYGSGNTTCASISTATDMEYLVYLSWLSGYLSAVNYRTPDLYDLVSEAGSTTVPAEQWIGYYCRLNPAHTVSVAVQAYTMAAWPGRTVSSPPPRYPAPPTTPALAPPEEQPRPQPTIPLKSRKRS